MTQVRLTEEQTRIVVQALEPVQICDNQGHLLAVVPPVWTAEDIEEAQRRLAADEPRYTTEQVLAHLRSLEGS